MERTRAAERNAKTDSVTRERRRIRNLETEAAELREWKAERIREDEETEDERMRVAFLLSIMAEDMESRSLHMELGEGLARTIITSVDLWTAASLLDPDD